MSVVSESEQSEKLHSSICRYNSTFQPSVSRMPLFSIAAIGYDTPPRVWAQILRSSIRKFLSDLSKSRNQQWRLLASEQGCQLSRRVPFHLLGFSSTDRSCLSTSPVHYDRIRTWVGLAPASLPFPQCIQQSGVFQEARPTLPRDEENEA